MATPTAKGLRETLSANLSRVRDRIARACERAGRDPASVSLVAVTKYGGAPLVESLLELGQLDLGENRVDRILELDAALAGPRERMVTEPRPRWHMIGHLQRNKARKVAEKLACLHSLDSPDLAAKLSARRAELGLAPLPCYIEVNSGEAQKSGVEPDEVAALAAAVAPLTHLRVVGLMTMPPGSEDPEAARPHFARLRGLLPALEAALGGAARGLSMGMTGDLEVAVSEGATVVRIGRALLDGIPEELLRAGA